MMTYSMALENAIAVVDAETAEKLTALKAQIEKKNSASSSKPTKTQLANEKVKDEILSVLGESAEALTVSEILALMENEYTNQKISALLRQLVASEKVVKTVEKKVSRFALA